MDNPKEIKPDWKDFLALVLAAYQLIIPLLLLILFIGVGSVFILLYFLR